METMMKKIAVVGANSYIARNLIYTINNLYPTCELYLYDYTDKHIDGCKNYTKTDILSQESVKKINFDCDVIYFFVGKTGVVQGFDDYETFIKINEVALLNLLHEYVAADSKAKIIFPSTRLVYHGKDGILPEDAEKDYKSVYAINKIACEQYLELYHRIYGVQYCTLRLCVPYGTSIPEASSYGTAEFMLNKAKKGEDISLYGDGSVRRTLTYMGDLCDILIKCGMSEKCLNDVFNIGGEDYSLKEMAALIAEKYNVKVSYVPYPTMAEKTESGSTVFDDAKLSQAIGGYQFKGRFFEWIMKQ